MQACRAIHLRGSYLHKFVCLPVNNNAFIQRLAELSITNLISKPKNLRILQIMQVLFIDDFGQVSTKILATLDIMCTRSEIQIHILAKSSLLVL